MKLEDKEYLGKGKRGLVYTASLDGRKVLVKEKNPSAAVDTVAHEAAMTQKLHSLGVGPAFIAYSEGTLVREYVDGERIEDFLGHASADEARSVVRQALEQCRTMDEAGINKQEMTHPYKHILVRRLPGGTQHAVEAVMIDFERCKHTRKPKNVTQFCQYLARIAPLLEKCGVRIDSENVKDLGMRYKQEGYDEKVFEELLLLFT